MFDIDMFINFQLNNGMRYYEEENTNYGCAKGLINACLGNERNDELAFILFGFSAKGERNSTIPHIILKIADKGEEILRGSHFGNMRHNYPFEQRKIKCKEFMLRALAKYGYINVGKDSIKKVREIQHV
jgi:hypothetical protein